MSVSILSIGTELTRGEITNTNCTWLCEQATQLGLEVVTCETIPDTHTAIRESLLRLSQSSRVILCTGGLGPTTDDITAQSVAQMLGVGLTRDVESYTRLAERLRSRGRNMTDSNAKQADLPAGARALSNAHGTAPGFGIKISETHAFFMPGVPGEMKPMFETHVAPKLHDMVSDFTACTRIHTYGATESAVNDLLAGIEEQHQVTIGYRAHFPQIEVKVLAKRAQRSDAERVAGVVTQEVEQRLGSVVFGRDKQTLISVVANGLRQHGWKLALAESCTAGHLSDLVASEPASDYFQGGVVSYSNAVKQSLLGVAETTLVTHGAVSVETVREMAAGACAKLQAHVSLAISGIAGPGGGGADKPVGTVCIALLTPKVNIAERFHFSGTRRQIQQRAAFQALDMLRRAL